MRNSLILIKCLLLCACTTPHEACISSAQRNLATVQGLIAQSQATIERGYAIETSERLITVIEPCPQIAVQKKWCERPETTTQKVAIGVDLDAERRKLQGLQAKEMRLRKRTIKAVGQCKAFHTQG